MQLTIQQAAVLFGVPESRIRRWIREQGLPAVVFDEQYRLNRFDLLVWAQAHRVPMPRHALRTDRAGGYPLAPALERGGIFPDLPGSSRGELVRAALERLVLPPSVDRELVLEMVEAREARGSTAVGHGVAMPHARYPIVAVMPEPILALGFARTPVDWDGPDGVPVFALFVLLTPSIRAHLDLAARLGAALSGSLLEPIVARADPAVILAVARANDVTAAAAAAAAGGGSA